MENRVEKSPDGVALDGCRPAQVLLRPAPDDHFGTTSDCKSIGNEYSAKFALPKVNREATKSFDRTNRDESTSDSRCSYTHKVTIQGGVTLQRTQ